MKRKYYVLARNALEVVCTMVMKMIMVIENYKNAGLYVFCLTLFLVTGCSYWYHFSCFVLVRDCLLSGF